MGITGIADVTDLELSYKSKIEESKILLDHNRFLSSIYLGGYAVEIILKVIITKKLGLKQLPSCFKIHKLESLLFVSGLEDELQQDINRHRKFAAINSSWSETIRYENPVRYQEASAKEFYNHLTDPEEGLLPWLEAKLKSI